MTTASLSPALRERLGKLLLMLSSNHAGEQAAAAAAIGKALQNAGCSWHDLVGQLFAEPPSPSPPRQPQSARRDPDPDELPTVMGDDEVARLIAAIFESGCRLTPNRVNFSPRSTSEPNATTRFSSAQSR